MKRFTVDSPVRFGALALVGATALWVTACGSDVSDGGTGGATSSGAGGTGGTTSSGTGGATSSGTGGATSSGGGEGAGGGGAAGAGGGGGVPCNPSGVTCDAPIPYCPPGEVASVDGYCWGPCVPVLSCATEPSCANCLDGFCAEYVAWSTEYRCVMPTLQCSALMCGCLAQYFCVSPFDACSEGGSADHVVSCGCPTC